MNGSGVFSGCGAMWRTLGSTLSPLRGQGKPSAAEPCGHTCAFERVSWLPRQGCVGEDGTEVARSGGRLAQVLKGGEWH